MVVLAFLGFDAVSAAAQEARNPQRDMPVAILSSLAICTILYILMAFVMTGLVKYPELNAPHPVFVAVTAAGPALHWLTYLINVAAMAGLMTVALVMLLAQSRIFFAMSRDGLLTQALSRGAGSRGSSGAIVPTIVTGVVAAGVAGFLPIGLLGDLTVIATLFVFVIVCAGLLILRYRRPNVRRPFRTPLVPAVPVLGIVFCGGILATLSSDTWIRFSVWTVLGLVIYFLYGARNSRLSREAAVAD